MTLEMSLFFTGLGFLFMAGIVFSIGRETGDEHFTSFAKTLVVVVALFTFIYYWNVP